MFLDPEDCRVFELSHFISVAVAIACVRDPFHDIGSSFVISRVVELSL